jgi:hypothetical protein
MILLHEKSAARSMLSGILHGAGLVGMAFRLLMVLFVVEMTKK